MCTRIYIYVYIIYVARRTHRIILQYEKIWLSNVDSICLDLVWVWPKTFKKAIQSYKCYMCSLFKSIVLLNLGKTYGIWDETSVSMKFETNL